MNSPNQLLAASGDDLKLFERDLRRVPPQAGEVLFEPEDRIRSVYFLHAGC